MRSRAYALMFAVSIASIVVGCATNTPVGEDAAGCRDRDGDTIGAEHEASDRDSDGDGVADSDDLDSDGDGIPDSEEAGDLDCATPPVDTDRDGVPDYLDLDSNADGIPDAEQRDGDLDGDGIPDWRDADVDGDGIQNVDELGMDGALIDTDGDGTPDVFDLDSDGDTILDADEGNVDRDRDGIPNFRDLDSDGDGASDADEAGDDDLATPPVHCAVEIDYETDEVRSDRVPDFLDEDSDGDGLTDREETERGSDRCGIDSDGDGVGDLVEASYARVLCPAGSAREPGNPACACEIDPDCVVPTRDRDLFVVLPYGGGRVDRTVEIETSIRAADVFFLLDTTSSMERPLAELREALAASGGLVDEILAVLPDTWFGLGTFDDFPFEGYGYAPFGDVSFRLHAPMSPASDLADLRAALRDVRIHAGGDYPEAGTFALFQIATGFGGVWRAPDGSSTETVPTYVARCSSGLGAPCFREDALPVVVMITNSCQHAGPPSDIEGGCNVPYGGPGWSFYGVPTPPPPSWDATMGALRSAGIRVVGLPPEACRDDAEVVPAIGPCYFLTHAARETGAVVDGRPVVLGGPTAASTRTLFEILLQSRADIDTILRADPHPTLEIDPRRFVIERGPACEIAPEDPECWTAPESVAHDDAVRAVDASTFVGVLPGTRVRFRAVLQNDFFEGTDHVEVFVVYLEVRADRRRRLEIIPIYVVVPAASFG